MNRILLLITAIFSSQLHRLKEVVLLFLQVVSQDSLSDNTRYKKKGLGKSFVISFVLLFFVYSNDYGQCSGGYPGFTTTQFSTNQTFCIDSNSPIVINNVLAQNYIVLNVIKGYTYSFQASDIWSGGTNREYLGVFDNSTNSYLIENNGTNGTSINNWVSTLSGQVKVLLLRGNTCASTASGSTGTITLTLNSIGNTQDSQVTAGTDTWTGHLYNWTVGPPPGGASPASPAASNPFSSTQYSGYYNVGSESINEGFGGDYNCFNVFSNGTQRASIYTEQFAVRYRMNTTKNGCYLINITGDDGVRLYLNGTLILDKWIEQSSTTYNNVLVSLDGNDDFIFDYYENGGQNVVAFTITPFDISTNTISPATTTVCSSGTTVALNGTSYLVNGAANPYLTFQWESSPNNSTWTNTGVTTEDYSPAPVTTTYYRRVVKAVSGTCSVTSASVVINVYPTNASVASVTGTSPLCIAGTATYSANSVVLSGGTGAWSSSSAAIATVSAAGLVTGVAVGTANIIYTITGGCGGTKSAQQSVTVNPVIASNTVSAAQTICTATTPAALTGSTATGGSGAYVYLWESSTTSAVAGFATA
ncbi:PA14 domain-containing protein, partial [Flavobacterium sp. ZT3R18]|uniref:PA14 domain-containing protein n=1 Tax=Flavobacterium sp. ZT3R18 TaxID=2594429 RepID=UPI00163DB459